jgi:hypothetical protein
MKLIRSEVSATAMSHSCQPLWAQPTEENSLLKKSQYMRQASEIFQLQQQYDTNLILKFHGLCVHNHSYIPKYAHNKN